MTDTIFNEDQVIEPEIDETKYEGMSPEDLKKKAIHADTHISKIEAENRTLREHTEQLRQQVAEKIAMEQLLEKLQTTQNKQPEPQDDKVTGPTVDDVRTIVSKELQTAEAMKRARDNLEFVKKELRKQFGSKYPEKMLEKAEELGFSKEEFDQFASTKPKAFLAAIGVEEKQSADTVVLRQPVSSVNTTNLHLKKNVKNKSYYDEIRKKEPSRYFSIETQNELLSEAMRQGDEFYKS